MESKPMKDEADKAAENCQEQAATAEAPDVDEESLDKRKSPELPIPVLFPQYLPTPEVHDKKGYLTDDEEQLTPSGTLSRDGVLDE